MARIGGATNAPTFPGSWQECIVVIVLIWPPQGQELPSHTVSIAVIMALLALPSLTTLVRASLGLLRLFGFGLISIQLPMTP